MQDSRDLTGERSQLYDRKLNFHYAKAENCFISISLREIIEFSILPTLRKIVLAIVSSFKNEKEFAMYDVDSLYVTGSLLPANYKLEYHMLLTKLWKTEILNSFEDHSLGIQLFVASERQKSRHILQNPTERHPFWPHVNKNYLDIISRYIYALRFNFQWIPVQRIIDNQQIVWEISGKTPIRIPSEYLYIITGGSITQQGSISKAFTVKNNKDNSWKPLHSIGKGIHIWDIYL